MAEKLYAHQERFLAKNPDRRLLCWDTGTGKTRAAIEWANKGKAPALYIVPKALRENWQRNLNFYSDYKSAIVTKEEFRRDHKELDKFPQVVVDEAHYFANEKSQLSKALQWYLKHWDVRRILLPTATPYLSSPWNIYTLAKHLREMWSWIEFRQDYFDDQFIGRRVIPVPKKGIEKQMAELVKSIGDVVRIDECADIPEQTFEVETFEQTKEQKKAIADFYDPNPIVRYTAHHQIEGGTYKDTEEQFPTMKTERLVALAKENKKIAVICRYNLEIDMLAMLLRSEGKLVHIINGAVKNRDGVVKIIEELDECVVLINAACSEGYEIPSVPLMVFWSLAFSYKDYKQMVGRILRINKLKKNVYLFLLTQGISMAVYNAIMNKQDFDIAIYARNQEEGEGLSDPLQPVV